VIDLGPEGGDEGGRVIVSGTPEQVAAVAESHTGSFLAGLLPVRVRRRREKSAAIG
jgi:excinuclease ABC subunit A